MEKCGVTEEEYHYALGCAEKKISIVYKRRPSEVNIGPYNTVILKLLKSNMNIQFVTGIYAMLTYLTSYLCKPEHTMSELMKKASKEAYGKDIRGKMHSIGNVFLTKREVSTHEAIKRVLSLPLRHSNIDVLYVPTGLKKNRTRMLKHLSVLEKMHTDDTNVFASNIVDKYENRPDELQSLCLADFASNYVSKTSTDTKVEADDIKSYTVPVSSTDDVEPNPNIIVLKNKLGAMRKRSRPCVIRFHKVSKLKCPEGYYLRLLQLYMPWRNESELKQDNQNYEDKYREVENQILCNIKKHEPYLDIDYEELHNFDVIESDDDEEDDEFSMINPNLLDLDMEESNDNAPVAATTIDDLLLPNEQFYEKCSQLNEGQLTLFNFIMKYAIQCILGERNNAPQPEPFHIFLSGGAGVGKSFLVHVVTEYLKRVLRYPNQNLDQPSVLVTASTGKAATGVNGTTLHSAFHLPVNSGFKSFEYRKPSDEVLHVLRNKYQYLKVLIIDEISMIGRETFRHLNLALQATMQNSLPFGGVSVLAVGDFLQLPPVNEKGVFMKVTKGSYSSFNGWLWQDFSLHELVEIVRQSGDPDFAQLLNRVREGKQTDNDIIQIKALANTNTSAWPDEFVRVFLNNYLAGKENEVFIIKAEDTKKDLETGTCSFSIPDYTGLNRTGNLPAKLKLCVGARIMLTDNISVSDRLINGSIGTVKHLEVRPNKPLLGTIYVKFDDPDAGNSLKDRRLRGELKECVPITAKTKRFPFRKGKTTIMAERKQFPAILGHAITIHKSQGSTLDYMKGDLNRSTGKKSSTGKEYKQPISQGQFYTLLSRAKSSDKVLLLNFEPEHIKVNEPALEEMEQMREESLFSWQHPLTKMSGSKMCLFNLRSWNAHIEHFLSDGVYTSYCSLLCFTETHIPDAPEKDIDELKDGWKSIHKDTQHGLAM